MTRTALGIISRTLRIAIFSLMLFVGLTMALWLNGSLVIARYSIDISGTTRSVGLSLSALILIVGLFGLLRCLRS